MRPVVSAAGLFAWFIFAWTASAAGPSVVEVWAGKVPGESGNIGPERVRMSPGLDGKQVEVTEPTRLITDVTKPTITVYRPTTEKNTGTAMLVCPGGGYWDLYWQLEGEEVAAWLNSIGVTGIILKYRVPRRPDEPKTEPARRPLQDAQRAVSLVRSKASEWGIYPDRIGIVGFSAGGHLAIATATNFDKRTYEPIDEVDKVSCRPDFAIPVYSGYLKAKDKDELAPGLRIPAGTPPVFLVHGGDDIISPPEHSVLMYLALKRAGIPAEMHIYAGTAHDFGVRASERPYSQWTASCADWLRDGGFLKPNGAQPAPDAPKRLPEKVERVNEGAQKWADQETRYLAFQIFTNYTPDPKDAQALSNGMREPLVPGTAALRNYVEDIKQRIGTVGDPQTRLAVMLGPLCFDQSDTEITTFVELAFNLASETDVAVGFHIDESIFWGRRKDLWGDPNNVEALDWDGTPCTNRRLDWGKEPTAVPPQMCFNSKVIQREVQQRAALLGKAIQAGVKQLHQRHRPELFAGVIAGWETMIGQDFKTGRYLGYRALLNRGFSRDQPPQDMDLEREKIVQEFIELWTTGLAAGGVSPEKIYSHIAFVSRRAFGLGDDKVTSIQRKGEATYSQHNHFAPPSVAFGKHHRPGFSTYPQPGLFDDIYEQLDKHKQVGWASSEGTNMQPATGPGQTGMGMETYLAKMFNHGATVVNLFSWGIGGEAMKTMGFRVVTEGDEALQAYRKFLKGEPLVEAPETLSLMDRLPPKIQKIQKELPAWVQKTGTPEKATALMRTLEEHLKAKNFEEAEKTADLILKTMQ